MKQYSVEQLKAAGMSAGLKYKVRSGVFENYSGSARISADCTHATSYSWWNAVTKIGPFIVFNACRYSNQTAKHLSKFRSLMRELGIRVDFDVYAHGGLQRLRGDSTSGDWRQTYSSSAEDHLLYMIKETKAKMQKRGSQRELNEIRALELKEYAIELKIVRKLDALRRANGARRGDLIRDLRLYKGALVSARSKTAKLSEKRYSRLSKARMARFEAKRAARAVAPITLSLIQGEA